MKQFIPFTTYTDNPGIKMDWKRVAEYIIIAVIIGAFNMYGALGIVKTELGNIKDNVAIIRADVKSLTSVVLDHIMRSDK